MESEAEDIRTAIAEISARLKGPGLSNIERLLLHEDRKDLRARLAQLSETVNGSDDAVVFGPNILNW